MYPDLDRCRIPIRPSCATEDLLVDRAKPILFARYRSYARVSTEDQNLDLQRRALEEAGCEEIFEDHGVSGLARRRPQLDAALERIQPGDVFVVWRLDRLGRSLAYVVALIEWLGQSKIGLRSLTEAIDSTTTSGRLILHIMGALAEFERQLIIERTKAGLAAARPAAGREGRAAEEADGSPHRPRPGAARRRYRDPRQHRTAARRRREDAVAGARG